MKKILIITYYWPPSGGSGVQRWLKFVKYFREFGIEPIILTVEPKYATYPVYDESLVTDIPDGIKIYRAKAKSPFRIYSKIRGKKIPHSGFAGESNPKLIERITRFVRGNFFIPDARKGWNKFASKEAKELIEKYQINCIVTTSPPHSTQLIGLELKKQFKLKWIMDLRDPWTDIYYNKDLYRTVWAKKRDLNLEKICIKNADNIIVVSKSIADLFSGKYAESKSRISVIPNGFDESDFQNLKRTKVKEKYISYIGNLGSSYPINHFLEAFKNFVDINQNWKLRFVGNVFEDVKIQIKELSLSNYVEFIPYVRHQEAIDFMVNSHALLLIIPDSEENKGILTGKLFEYLAARKPIIFIGPKDGDAADILKESSHVLLNDYVNIESLELFFMKENLKVENHDFIKKFTRKNLTRDIASLILEPN